MTEKRVMKWWGGWNPERLENYLEGMAREGWRLSRVTRSMLGFSFTRSTPEWVRVCVDYRQKVTADYLALFEDAGWESVGQSAGWILWRKPYDGDAGDARPEIYSDRQSLLARNRRVIMTVILALALQVPIFLVNMGSIFTAAGRWLHSPLAVVVMSLYVLVVSALVLGLVRLVVANRKLAHP